MSAAIFRELLGFSVPDAKRLVADVRAQLEQLSPIEWLRPSIVPHAPYSVSPELLRAIAAARQGRRSASISANRRKKSSFSATGPAHGAHCSPGWVYGTTHGYRRHVRRSTTSSGTGLLNDQLVAVHCVQLSDADLHKLADANATVVTCPRSNRWTGAGLPPIERFYASGVRVAVGTDSLASVEDLNVFGELALMRELAPSVPAGSLLESATRHGASALGFGHELGTIEPGKRAQLIAVSTPVDVADVEQYLVSGITPDRIQWLA